MLNRWEWFIWDAFCFTHMRAFIYSICH